MNAYRIETRTLSQVLEDVREENIRDDAATQRDFKGTSEFINNMIYSATSGKIFIQTIILSEEDGVYYVVDGNHRLKALNRFKEEGYRISSTIRHPIITYERKVTSPDGEIVRDQKGNPVKETVEYDLRGKTYDVLPKEIQDEFLRCPIVMAIYSDCTSIDTAELVNLYNVINNMSASQKALTYIGNYADEIKRIRHTNRFLKDCTGLTETDKKNGIWERVISESIMGLFHFDNWKSDPKKICDYLNENSSLDEIAQTEKYFNRLIPYTDKLENKEVSDLFIQKDFVVWMMVFKSFTELNRPDCEFGDFLKAFVDKLHLSKVNDATWDEVDTLRSTKDKRVITQKIDHLTYLMNEFLGVENSSDIEETENEEDIVSTDDNTYTNENSNEDKEDVQKSEGMENKEVDDSEIIESDDLNNEEDSVLDFVKRNVSKDITEEDVDDCYELIDYCKNRLSGFNKQSQLLDYHNEASLIGIMAFAMCNDIDLDRWIVNYSNQNITYSTNQKENYVNMVNSLQNFVNNTQKVGCA